MIFLVAILFFQLSTDEICPFFNKLRGLKYSILVTQRVWYKTLIQFCELDWALASKENKFVLICVADIPYELA